MSLVDKVLDNVPIVGTVLNLLKGAGIVKDPQMEQEYRLKLLEAATRGDESWTDFIKATQPVGQVIAGAPGWVNAIGAVQNFLVAMVRPLITAFAAFHIYTAMSAGREVTSIAWIPVAFWFLGRSAEKLLGVKLPGLVGNGDAAPSPSTPEAPPSRIERQDRER